MNTMNFKNDCRCIMDVVDNDCLFFKIQSEHNNDKNEYSDDTLNKNQYNDEKMTVKDIKEETVVHSLDLSSFHDDNSRNQISRCSNSDDSSSHSSSRSSFGCSACSSVISCTNSDNSFADHDDIIYDPFDLIENWIDIDISSTCDDDDDDNLSETSYTLSTASYIDIGRNDSFILFDYNHHQVEKSEQQQQQRQHDIAMKQPWHTITTSNRMLAVDDNSKQHHRRRRVKFDTNTYVKEYNLTVGAYSSVNDTCPLQLTWEHTTIQIIPLSDRQQLHRIDHKAENNWLPHCMNLKERRHRIATLNDITVRDVYMLEQQMILWQIQDALNHNHQIMIHNLNFQDNMDPDNNSLSPDQHRYQDVTWHTKCKKGNTNNIKANTSIRTKNNNKGMTIATTKHHNGQDTKYKKICHLNDKNAPHPLSSGSNHSQ